MPPAECVAHYCSKITAWCLKKKILHNCQLSFGYSFRFKTFYEVKYNKDCQMSSFLSIKILEKTSLKVASSGYLILRFLWLYMRWHNIWRWSWQSSWMPLMESISRHGILIILMTEILHYAKCPPILQYISKAFPPANLPLPKCPIRAH